MCQPATGRESNRASFSVVTFLYRAARRQVGRGRLRYRSCGTWAGCRCARSVIVMRLFSVREVVVARVFPGDERPEQVARCRPACGQRGFHAAAGPTGESEEPMCAAEYGPQRQYRRIGITVGVVDRVRGRQQPEMGQSLPGDPDGLGGQVRSGRAAAGWDGPAVGVDAEQQPAVGGRAARRGRWSRRRTWSAGRRPRAYDGDLDRLGPVRLGRQRVAREQPGCPRTGRHHDDVVPLAVAGSAAADRPVGMGDQTEDRPGARPCCWRRGRVDRSPANAAASGRMKPARFSRTPTVPSGSPCQPRLRELVTVDDLGRAGVRRARSRRRPPRRPAYVARAGRCTRSRRSRPAPAGLASRAARPGSRSPAGVAPGGSRMPGRRHPMPRWHPCRAVPSTRSTSTPGYSAQPPSKQRAGDPGPDHADSHALSPSLGSPAGARSAPAAPQAGGRSDRRRDCSSRSSRLRAASAGSNPPARSACSPRPARSRRGPGGGVGGILGRRPAAADPARRKRGTPSR